jgi:2,4-dienoyl-CoA reductase-like NADH-dependent reductase (Old Yellow Enzyme family)/thioredoxin reductase
MSDYPNLFSPLKVNSLILKNRIIAAPMGGGFIGAHIIESLAARARGGAALIILGSSHVDNDRSLIAPGWPGLYEPFMESYMDQLNVIHQYGAKASLELFHAGLWADVAYLGKNPFGPVDMVRDIGLGKDADGAKVDAMTEEDMMKVAESYAATTVRAKKFGFDMCMLHFAHGWLPAQFLSPKFNKRKDKYGGSFENRIRFPRLIVDKVRQAVGPDYPLDMRISGDERSEDGIDLKDVIGFVQLIEDKIDMIHVSSGIDKYWDLTTYIETPQLYPHLINLHLAEAMKKAVKIPVVTVGAITMPDEAENILAEGKADGVAMARALLADPEWPNKARSGRGKDIVPCLRCNACYHVAIQSLTHGCAVNPVFCREERVKTDLMLGKPGKKIAIIGGGPAGMKAAITAVERGHKVTLFEKEAELGGLINVSEFEEKKIDLRNYRRYLVNKVLDSDIILHLNTEATPETIKALKPDAVVVAVGSVPHTPRIKGADLPLVLQAVDAYRMIPRIGKKVVIIGGGEVGCELGLSLGESGRKTLIIEMTNQLAPRGNLLYKTGLQTLMEKEKNLSWKMEIICQEITGKGVKSRDKAGNELFFEADTVILATGMKPLKDLAESFYGIVYDVKMIGDCVEPRKVDDATYEGFFAITSL